MKIKEIQTEPAFKPFKIEIEIESADDLLWLYGVSNASIDQIEKHFSYTQHAPHKFTVGRESNKFQDVFYREMKKLYERKILQNS